MARKSKFSEADIIGAIREIEGGATQADVARRMGVSTQTMQRWRAKYGGMTVSEAQDKRRLEDENRKLRSLVAQYALENESLKCALGKKW
jgi:putative transposase